MQILPISIMSSNISLQIDTTNHQDLNALGIKYDIIGLAYSQAHTHLLYNWFSNFVILFQLLVLYLHTYWLYWFATHVQTMSYLICFASDYKTIIQYLSCLFQLQHNSSLERSSAFQICVSCLKHQEC